MARDRESRPDGIEERVVKIRRCAAVVKGGRKMLRKACAARDESR